MTRSTSRLDWVDMAKALGIVLVVYGHVARGTQLAGVGLPSKLFLLIDSVIYSFHMPLFFFLSGLFFTSSYDKQGGSGLVASKIDTVLYPYAVWSLLQGTIEVIFQGYKNVGTSVDDLIATLWHPRAQFWFLYVLFLLFGICALNRALLKSRSPLAVLALSVVLYFVPPTGWYLVNLVNANLVFFAWGICYPNSTLSRWLKPKLTCGLLITMALLAQYVAHAFLGFKWDNRGMATLGMAGLMILCLTSVSMNLASRAPSALVQLGRNSMPIYLMHILFGGSFRVLLHRFVGLTDPLLHLVAGTLIGLFGPLYAYRLLQRWGWHYLFSAPVSQAIRPWLNQRSS